MANNFNNIPGFPGSTQQQAPAFPGGGPGFAQQPQQQAPAFPGGQQQQAPAFPGGQGQGYTPPQAPAQPQQAGFGYGRPQQQAPAFPGGQQAPQGQPQQQQAQAPQNLNALFGAAKFAQQNEPRLNDKEAAGKYILTLSSSVYRAGVSQKGGRNQRYAGVAVNFTIDWSDNGNPNYKPGMTVADWFHMDPNFVAAAQMGQQYDPDYGTQLSLGRLLTIGALISGGRADFSDPSTAGVVNSIMQGDKSIVGRKLAAVITLTTKTNRAGQTNTYANIAYQAAPQMGGAQ